MREIDNAGSGLTPYEYCSFCGKGGANRGQRPHNDDPCPLAVAEHEARVEEILSARDPYQSPSPLCGLSRSPRGDRPAPAPEVTYPDLLPGWTTTDENRLGYWRPTPGVIRIRGAAIPTTANPETDPVFILPEDQRPVFTQHERGYSRVEPDGRVFFLGAWRSG